MKLKLSDYLIGILYVLPTFGTAFFGLTTFGNLNPHTTLIISIIFTIMDYSYHLRSVRNENIIYELQKKLEKENE